MLRVTAKEVEPEQTSGEQHDTGDFAIPHYTWTNLHKKLAEGRYV